MSSPIGKRILVIGAGGTGKSTFSRTLGERTGLPVHHLDRLFWKPGWVSETTEIFDRKLQDILLQDSWIIDGNYGRTLPERLDRADMVIYLDFSRWTALWGVIKRRFTTSGTRPDVTEGCPENLNREFLWWILWDYPRRRPARIRQLTAWEKNQDGILHRPRNRTALNRLLQSWDRT